MSDGTGPQTSWDPSALLVPILNLADRVEKCPAEIIPALLGALAGLQMSLLAQLLARGLPPTPAPRTLPDPDRLLTAVEVAPMLKVSPRWLYRHAGKLPFTKRLSRKALRFSELGLQRYLAARRP